MPRAVLGHQAGLSRIYKNDDGSTTTLSGGSVAWRNNNPGNVEYGANARAAGAIGRDDHGFAIFPNYQSGVQGMVNVLRNKYGNYTIDQMMKGYAPPSENNTARYTAFVKASIGLTGDTAIRDLSPDQFERLVNAIHVFEGWHPGTITGPDANMGGLGSATVVQRRTQASPLQQGSGAAVPYLAQEKAVAPAFGATTWPPPPASPNVLPSHQARPFAGAPRTGPVPSLDGTTTAQQALDASLPAAGAAPWNLSDRFGTWDAVDGASGPVKPGGSSAAGQIGDGNGIGDWWNNLAPTSASNSAPAPVRRLSSPILGIMPADPNQSSPQLGASLGLGDAEPDAAPFPSVPYPLEALLAPDRNRALHDWASSSPRKRGAPAAPPTGGVFGSRGAPFGNGPSNPSQAASRLPPPFNDYGTQPQRTLGRIGDGRGIGNWWGSPQSALQAQPQGNLRANVPAPGSAPSSSSTPALQDKPGGILGMMIDAGLLDPVNPTQPQPEPGGLLGMILQAMRNDPMRAA